MRTGDELSKTHDSNINKMAVQEDRVATESEVIFLEAIREEATIDSQLVESIPNEPIYQFESSNGVDASYSKPIMITGSYLVDNGCRIESYFTSIPTFSDLPIENIDVYFCIRLNQPEGTVYLKTKTLKIKLIDSHSIKPEFEAPAKPMGSKNEQTDLLKESSVADPVHTEPSSTQIIEKPDVCPDEFTYSLTENTHSCLATVSSPIDAESYCDYINMGYFGFSYPIETSNYNCPSFMSPSTNEQGLLFCITELNLNNKPENITPVCDDITSGLIGFTWLE